MFQGLKGIFYVLAVGAITPCIIALLAVASLLWSSPIPIALGSSVYFAVLIIFHQKRDQKYLEAEMRSFPVSPETQAQALDDYVKLGKKKKP